MNTSIICKRALLVALASLCLLGLFGQAVPDTLFLHSGRAMAIHVTEMGLDEIKYHLPGDDLRISVERSQVAMVKMADGREYRMRASELSAELAPAVLNRTQAIKFHFLSPAFNHLTFGYERVLKPWTNLDLTAGYIGVGLNSNRPPASGFLFRGGVKFISRPDVVVRGMRMAHPLHGRYVKPEVVFNAFTILAPRQEWGGAAERSMRYMNAALNVVIGKQRFLGDGATLDTWVGVGYVLRVEKPDLPYFSQPHQYTHIPLGSSSPLILSAGLSLGVAFNGRKKQGQE